MKRIIVAAAGLILPLAISSAPVNAQAAQRHYDCSKAGNANKAVCKSAAAPVAPAPAPKARNYDCSKAGNANKAVCKSAAPAMPAPTAAPAPRAQPAPAQRPMTRTATGQNTNPAGPNGATAKCRDGTMSMSAHRSGTCSRHGGVAQFY